MESDSIAAGRLLPVLRRANHADLYEVVEALNRAFDSVIKWDDRYAKHREDLTQIPEVIADHLCRAGGHSVRNWFRGGGPEYREVVQDVCGALGVKLPPTVLGVVEMEALLVQDLVKRAEKGMSDEEKADLLKKMKEKAGRPVGFEDLVKTGTLLGLLAPLVFAAIAQQALMRGLAATAQLALTRLGASVAGPIGFVAGSAWLISDIAGPSRSGTIPAVAQVALLRQRMMWEDRA